MLRLREGHLEEKLLDTTRLPFNSVSEKLGRLRRRFRLFPIVTPGLMSRRHVDLLICFAARGDGASVTWRAALGTGEYCRSADGTLPAARPGDLLTRRQELASLDVRPGPSWRKAPRVARAGVTVADVRVLLSVTSAQRSFPAALAADVLKRKVS